MNKIYNTNKYLYQNLSDYLNSVASETGDVFRVLLLTDLDTIFEGAKKRTAMRGRFAADQQGPLLEKIALTDDERDWYDEIIKNGSSEVFRKVSAWAKQIDEAYRHNVKFGDPVLSGAIDSVAGVVLNDTSKAMTVNELIGYKAVITSPGTQMNQERTITGNTATSITIDSVFTTDVTGMEYAVFTQTSDFIIYYLNLNASQVITVDNELTTQSIPRKDIWDINMIQGVDASVLESLIDYTVKEWYLINRMADDYTIEDARYEKELVKIRSQLMQQITPSRRAVDFFQ